MTVQMHPAQERALDHVRDKSTGSPVKENYDITVNFHPDRKSRDGLPILSAIFKDQVLKSQFSTGTSSGGLTAYPGGDRWIWESRAFGGAYDHSDPGERPIYGALNYQKLGGGGSPRFGSAYFRLKSHVLNRTTFCYPDSFFTPKDFATYPHISKLINLAETGTLDLLDNYIEAHIHGPVHVKNDVESVVLDPVFKNTDIERLATKLPCDIEWHQGFQLHVKVVAQHPEYRGLQFVELAKKLAEACILNPLILGNAVQNLGYDPQDIKKIWHYLARFGDQNHPQKVEIAM